MAQSHYSRGELLWLLSLSREQAIDLDAYPKDSCADLSTDGQVGGDEEPISVIARWADVQRAKREIERSKRDLAILQLRSGGFSETEISKLSGVGRLAVRRRFHATVDEIHAALGGPPLITDAKGVIGMCLICGEHPRVRLGALTVKVRGGTRVLSPEHDAAVCELHLDPLLAPRILRAHLRAA